ncbi:MAG TPA: hypothetical protein VL691_24020 [Vicinamibacteria bacterium]|nr:hypothetical protein [Vicinamibacteria bacterium]
MSRRRPAAWLVAAALAVPLVALAAWVIRGAVDPHAPQPHPTGPAGVWPGLPQHRVDLPADRLEEQVDGGADALRKDGCRRLVSWRFERPPADAEALFFATVDGARAVLDREAGAERTPGPGDEAQVSPQTVYFRRGTVLARVLLDPGAPDSPGELLARARDLDHALQERGPS